MKSTGLSAVICLLCVQASTHAQQDPQRVQGSPDVLQLGALQQAAIEADPRFRALPLQQAQTELRLDTIEAERLPSIAAEAQAQYQSDVPTPPAIVPGGRPLFSPLKDTYDAYFRIDQRILDPTIRPRMAVERAQLAEGQARVRATLFGLRQEVNDAFFAAALLQERAGALAATIADLETRLQETNARVREGAALAADAAAVEATLLQRRQDEEELRANRATALTRLSDLTDRTISDSDSLAIPEIQSIVAQARSVPAGTRARPEYEQFARTQDRLVRQQEAASAQDQPRLSAFARVGYGRPGLNFISDRFESYGVAGVQVQWKAWTWGTTNREREALAIQQQIVAADEAAFTKGIGLSVEGDLATIDRLERALALDDRIVALREDIDRTAELRLREGVVIASEYLDRSTELLEARFARSTHRVELAQVCARFLTTLGLEVR